MREQCMFPPSAARCRSQTSYAELFPRRAAHSIVDRLEQLRLLRKYGVSRMWQRERILSQPVARLLQREM